MGYLLTEIGLSEAGRSLARGCMAAEVPLRLLDIPLPGGANERQLAPRIGHWCDLECTLLISWMDRLELIQQR